MKLHCKTIFTIFISVLFFSCISCSKNIEGEITGINASTPIDNMKNMVYDGSLEVTLSNGEKIKVLHIAVWIVGEKNRINHRL